MGLALLSHFKQKAHCTERDLKHHINGDAQILYTQLKLKEERLIAYKKLQLHLQHGKFKFHS